MRGELMRRELYEFTRRVPFQPFLIALENGDRVRIDHPENVAFDPPTENSEGSRDFYVLSGGVRLYATFDSMTALILADAGVRA